MTINKHNDPIETPKDKYENLGNSKIPIRISSLSKKLLVKGENRREFEELRGNILKEMLPVRKIEDILCEKIISAEWRMKRAMVMERNLLNAQNEISEEERDNDSYNSPTRKRVRNIKRVRVNDQEIQYIIQYQIDLEKGLQKALDRLRDEQALRAKTPLPKND